METSIRWKITGEEPFIERLRQYAAEHSADFQIEGEEFESVPERLGFDFGIIVTIIGAISGAVTIGRAVIEIVKALQESKTSKALVQSSTEIVEIRSEDSAADNITKLSTLLEVPPKQSIS